MKSFEIILKPVPPFDFDSTVYVPHYFPTPDFEWQPNSMWQTLNLDRKLLGLKMENKRVTDSSVRKLTIYPERRLADASSLDYD